MSEHEETEAEKMMKEHFEKRKEDMNAKGRELLIKLDRSEEMVAKDEEINRLKNTKSQADLVFDAHKLKLEAEYEKLGIPFQPEKVTSLEDIRYHEAVIRKLASSETPDKSVKDFSGGGNSPSLQGQLQASKWKIEDDAIPIDFMKFESEEELVDVVNHIAKNPKDSRQKEAQEYVEKLNQKLLKKGLDAEYQGEITKIQGQKDTEEKRREKRKWTMK